MSVFLSVLTACGVMLVIPGALFLCLTVISFRLASLCPVGGVFILDLIKLFPGTHGTLGHDTESLHMVTDIRLSFENLLGSAGAKHGIKEIIHDPALNPESVSGALALVLRGLLDILCYFRIFPLIYFQLICVKKIVFKIKMEG